MALLRATPHEIDKNAQDKIRTNSTVAVIINFKINFKSLSNYNCTTIMHILANTRLPDYFIQKELTTENIITLSLHI